MAEPTERRRPCRATTRRAVTTLVVAGATVAWLAPMASGASTPSSRLLTVITPHGAETSPALSTSTSDAGYTISPGGVFLDTTTDAYVPPVQCSSAVTHPIVIDALENGTLPSSTASGSGFAVTITCSGSTAAYSLSTVDDGVVSHPSAIAAGTQLVLTASVTPTSEQYSLHNKTTGKTTTYTGAGLSTVSLQDTTQFGSGTSGGFAPFKDSAYLDLTVNGQGLDGLPISGVSQVDGAGKVLVQATPLASNGEAFALIYKSNVGDAGR